MTFRQLLDELGYDRYATIAEHRKAAWSGFAKRDGSPVGGADRETRTPRNHPAAGTQRRGSVPYRDKSYGSV